MADLIVQCPTCSKAVAWLASSRHRPFCCERCRLIDLGEWADGNRRIPSAPAQDTLAETHLKDQES